MKDLEPEGATLEQKFVYNSFGGENVDNHKTVTLRIARVNHAC